jgi:tetratricopeptide (TPR) repeat protein
VGCLSSLALADLSRGAYPDLIARALAAAALATRPGENLGIAALAATYADDVDQARELRDRMVAAAPSPTARAFAAYVSGEIDTAGGHRGRAEGHYAAAIDLAHTSGATFVVGIASVGLLTLRARTGRVPDALRGYRDLIDYWDRAGNWTQQWVTVRNLAQLLREIGDDEPAKLLDAAAQEAPDASAVGPTADTPRAAAPETPAEPRPPRHSRERALEVARQAILRNLTRS